MWKCQCGAACTYFRIIRIIEYQHHFNMSRYRYDARIHRNAIRTCEMGARVSVCICDEQQSQQRSAISHSFNVCIMMAMSIVLNGVRTLV